MDISARISVYLLVLFIVFSGCNKPINKAKISGLVMNPRDSIIICSGTDFIDTLEVNAKGAFNFEITLNKPVWVKLHSAKNNQVFYLQPGSNVQIDFDADKFWASMKIIGQPDPVNQYLINQQTLFYGHRCNNISFRYESSVPEYFEALVDLQTKLSNNFDKFVADYGKKYRHFSDTEKLRLKYQMAALKLQYGSFVDYDAKLSDVERIEYFDFLNDIDLNLPENEQLHEFFTFASLYVDRKADVESRNIDSRISGNAGYIHYVFELITTEFKSHLLLEYLYYEKLYDFLMYYGCENLESYYNEFMKMSKSIEKKYVLQNLWDRWLNIAPGKVAPVFSGTDVNGKVRDITEFSGQLLVVDVWASWCGPCVREIPHFEALKKKYAREPVSFLSVSVDDNMNEWLSAIDNYKLSGNQWYAAGWNNDLCKFYQINSIPRFILIDDNGNIINANASPPSGDLESLITASLNGKTQL